MSYFSRLRRWSPSTTAQLSLPLKVERTSPPDDAGWREEWDRHVASLETHVVDGTFCPPLRDERTSATRHYTHRRRPQSLDARVPASLLSYDPATRIYRTTYARLCRRGILFCNTITIVDGEAEVPLRLFQVARRGEEWTRMRFRHLVGGRVERELIVVNTEAGAGAPAEARTGQPIAVERDGDCWVARFSWSEASMSTVRRAGFRFSPLEGRWATRDRRVAVRLEAAIRGEKTVVAPARRRPFIR